MAQIVSVNKVDNFISQPIYADNLNQVVYDMAKAIYDDKNPIKSENGALYEANFVKCVLTNPQYRHICLPDFESNIFAVMAEAFWVLGCDDNYKLFPLMTTVAPHYIKQSDDLGQSLRGNYNRRIYTNNQVSSVLEQFRQDGVNTRRAVMSIWRADIDAQSVIGDCNKSKNVPTALSIQFFIKNNKMFMSTTSRKGTINHSFIDFFTFSLLHELFSDMVRKEYNLNIDLGPCVHEFVSLLSDNRTIKQVDTLLSQGYPKGSMLKTFHAFLEYEKGKTRPQFFRDKMNEIYNVLCHLSTCRYTNKAKHTPKDLFDIGNAVFGESYRNNQLFWYFFYTGLYLLARNNIKHGNYECRTVKEIIERFDLARILPNTDLGFAVSNCPCFDKDVSFTEEEDEALKKRFEKSETIIKG